MGKINEKWISSIKILLSQSQIFGLITFTFTKTGFLPSKLRCIYNILGIFLYIPLNIHCILKIVVFQKNQVIYKTTDTIILIFNAVYVVTTWICAITRRDEVIELLQKIMDFDAKLQSDGIVVDYNKPEQRIFKHMMARWAILSAVITTLLMIVLFYFKHAILSVEIMAYCLLVINSAICHQTTEIIILLGTRFAILNKQIQILIDYYRKRSKISIDATKLKSPPLGLNKICTMHHHLTKLVKLFNNIFGVILLLTFTVSFVVIVITLFYFTSIMQSKHGLRLFGVLNPILSNITLVLDVFYICGCCHFTIQEAKKSGELIHKIDSAEPAVRDQIEMFSLQIANEQIEFNAAGFFRIDYTLVFSIIGGVTTYIIILIQLAATLANQ